MLKISDLAPLNLASEKEKFFQSGFKYNPQFVYATSINQQELTKYGKPKFLYLLLAKKILWQYHRNPGLHTSQPANKKFLSQAEITQAITDRLADYGLANTYQINFSESFVSRIAVQTENKIVKVKLPVAITKEEIEGTLAHEVDTHLVRQLNYERQIWYKKKKKYGLLPHLRTEEGLAIVNELVANKQKLAYKSAINYLAVNVALKKDFVSVFEFFYKHSGDTERSWIWTVKQKRGLQDTSLPGGFTKNVVYLEGLLQVLYYLRSRGGDPSRLYCGKIDWRDLEKVKKIGIKTPVILPKIYTENSNSYKKEVELLFKINLL